MGRILDIEQEPVSTTRSPCEPDRGIYGDIVALSGPRIGISGLLLVCLHERGDNVRQSFPEGSAVGGRRGTSALARFYDAVQHRLSELVWQHDFLVVNDGSEFTCGTCVRGFLLRRQIGRAH